MFMMSWYADTIRLRTSTIALNDTCDLEVASITVARSVFGSPSSKRFWASAAAFWLPATLSTALRSRLPKPPAGAPSV